MRRPAFAVEPMEDQHAAAAHGLQAAARSGDSRARGQRERDRFPKWDVPFVIGLRNFANARRPSPSRTDALGRAPPSEAPGMRSSRRSSSSSDSAATRSAAPSRRGSSTSGGTRVGEGGARKGPSGVSRKRRGSLARFIVHPEQEIRLGEGPRGSSFPLCVPLFGSAQEHASPAVGGGIVEGAEQLPSGFRVIGAAAQLQSGIQGKAGGLLQPARVVFKRGASAISAHPQPDPVPHSR